MYDQSVQINHNLNWPYIPDHPYRILIIGGSGGSVLPDVIELNKISATRYWLNLLTCQRSIWIKVTIS